MSTFTPANQVVAQRMDERLYTNLRFPLAGYTHGIILMFQPYDYENTDGLTRSIATENSTIVLPLPTNLQDSYRLKVGGNDLGMTGGLATDIAGALGGSNAALNDLSGIAGQLSGLNSQNTSIEGLVGSGASMAKYFSRNLLSAIPGEGNIAAGIDVATGTAINPHTTVTFDGVNLKEHNFQWNLSPKSSQEANVLNNIIRKIRSRILPQYRDFAGGDAGQTTLGRGLLSYPDLVHVMFVGVNNDYFYYFKPAMVQAFDINYAPNGVALNRGGLPSTVSISMAITEARIHTRADVNDAPSPQLSNAQAPNPTDTATSNQGNN